MEQQIDRSTSDDDQNDQMRKRNVNQPDHDLDTRDEGDVAENEFIDDDDEDADDGDIDGAIGDDEE